MKGQERRSPLNDRYAGLEEPGPARIKEGERCDPSRSPTL
jgi:hypothetical protein